MLRLEDSNKLESTLNGSVLTVGHQCDILPESSSPYTFSSIERDAIVTAAEQAAYEHSWTYLQESSLHKIVAEICNNETTTKLIISIISQTNAFYSALNANKDVDARIKSTQQLIDAMDALSNTLGEETFNALTDKLYALSNKNHLLRVIPLMVSDLHNQAALMKHFMLGELLGHGVAYKIAQNEAVINKLIMKSINTAEKNEFNVREIIVKCDSHEENQSLRDKSLMASILTPIYKDGVIPAEPTIYITWTGTYNQSTLLADLQINAGEESYRHAEQQILNQVMQSLSAFKDHCKEKPFRIIISGHSLGGALSQLLYHSLQRQLASSINIGENKTLDETAFLNTLKASAKDYQQNDSIGKLVSNKGLTAKDVSELSLAVWNPTGVLQAVEDHSNVLAPFLRTNANILQTAYIGHVGGDAVQVTGQGTILSDVEKNQAQVSVLKIEPNTLRATTTAGGLIGSLFSGALIISSLTPLGPVIGAGIGLTFAIGAIAKKSLDAHTMKHFSINFQSLKEIFGIPYRIFFSHLPNGSLNQSPTTGFAKVKEQISRKSVTTNSFTQLVNTFGLMGSRNNETTNNTVKPTSSPSLSQ